MMFQSGDIVLNKYLVETFLGCGHFGEVYRVQNQTLGCVSALKIIQVSDPDNHKAGVEAFAQSICDHANVVRIRTAEVFQQAVIIEMEFVEGGSFGSKLRHDFVPIPDSLQIIKQILFALEHAHSKGFVHRDVKPENIMLAGPTAKLSDFGTVIHPATGTRATNLFYTPHAPPESINNHEFSAHTDVYAAGMTLLRAVNNLASLDLILNAPNSDRDIAEGILASRIGFAPFIPRKLIRIINKAVHNESASRYQSAAEMREALERLRPLRGWKRINPDTWMCNDLGSETIMYVGGRKFSVEYKKNNRRHSPNCRNFNSENEARKFMARHIAKSTFE